MQIQRSPVNSLVRPLLLLPKFFNVFVEGDPFASLRLHDVCPLLCLTSQQNKVWMPKAVRNNFPYIPWQGDKSLTTHVNFTSCFSEHAHYKIKTNRPHSSILGVVGKTVFGANFNCTWWRIRRKCSYWSWQSNQRSTFTYDSADRGI